MVGDREPGGPLAAHAVGVQTLDMNLAHLVAVGFLPAPVEKGDCELPKLDEARS